MKQFINELIKEGIIVVNKTRRLIEDTIIRYSKRTTEYEVCNLVYEFEQYKMLHMLAVTKAKLILGYKDMLIAGLTIPNYLEDKSPEDNAQIRLEKLLDEPEGHEKFIESYHKAWNSIAELLP